MEFSKTFPI